VTPTGRRARAGADARAKARLQRRMEEAAAQSTEAGQSRVDSVASDTTACRDGDGDGINRLKEGLEARLRASGLLALESDADGVAGVDGVGDSAVTRVSKDELASQGPESRHGQRIGADEAAVDLEASLRLAAAA